MQNFERDIITKRIETVREYSADPTVKGKLKSVMFNYWVNKGFYHHPHFERLWRFEEALAITVVGSDPIKDKSVKKWGKETFRYDDITIKTYGFGFFAISLIDYGVGYAWDGSM